MAKSKKKRKSRPKGTKQSRETVAQPESDKASERASEGSLLWLVQMRGFFAMLYREPIAIGLALFILPRPWKDGLTYPYFNIYFTGWIFVLATFFVIRMLVRAEKIHNPIPVALFAGYLLVSFVSLRGAVDYDVSLRALLLYVSYFFIFLMASNAIKTRLAFGIVLGALVATTLVNTVWAVIHAEYILPYVRESIKADPRLLATYFSGATVLNPELKNRLEMGRAFGTFLFPNALGGFLALCVPYMIGEAMSSIRRFREALEMDRPIGGIENSSFATLLTATLAAFLMGVYVYSVSSFLSVQTEGTISLISGSTRTFVFIVFFPCAFGLIGGYIVHLKGGVAYGAILRTLVLFLAFALQSYGLWLTFSRGAFLGVAVGATVALFLVFSGSLSSSRMNPVAKVWVRVLLALMVAAAAWNPAVKAQELQDDGFILPNTEIDYRPDMKTYDVKKLEVEGTDVELSDLASSRSLEFRLTYWKVGLLIARDHWLLGVGPGNFGTVYGGYQYLDAHPVKMAHNDYLQALVETGIFGFILFTGFWTYFIVWGGARILHETCRYRRMAMAGIYAGVIAFLVHVFFDFHFANPALASMVYLMTGLFYARANAYKDGVEEVDTPRVASSQVSRWIALGGIVIVFISASAAARQFLFDFGRTAGTTEQRLTMIGEVRIAEQNYSVIEYLLGPYVQTYYKGKQGPDGMKLSMPQRRVYDFRLLVDSYDELELLGPVRVELEGGTRATRDRLVDEPITDNGILFIIHPEEARKLAYRLGDARLTQLEATDELYPYATNICASGFRLTRMLSLNALDPKNKTRYSRQCLDWAQKSVERSPGNPTSHIQLSGALWEMARAEPTKKQLDYLREGIVAYRRSLTLYPTESQLLQGFGQSMMTVGEAFERAGFTEEGEGYKAEARDAHIRAALLARYKYDVLGLR